MNGWFWSSAFGPGPSAAIGKARVNGLPGHVITAKKKALTASSVAPTHGSSGASRPRDRGRSSSAHAVARSVQTTLDPSRAAHRLITEKIGVVVVALLRAT